MSETQICVKGRFAIYIFIILLNFHGLLSSRLRHNRAVKVPCKESIKTVEEVRTCPKGKEAWDERARLKGCGNISHNCSDKQLSYHCVLDEFGYGLVEVCAVCTEIIGEKCAEFTMGGMFIQEHYENGCRSCPFAYNSSMGYLYGECFDFAVFTTVGLSTEQTEKWFTDVTMPTAENVYIPQTPATASLVWVLGVIVPFVWIGSLVLFYRCKHRGKQNKDMESLAELSSEEAELSPTCICPVNVNEAVDQEDICGVNSDHISEITPFMLDMKEVKHSIDEQYTIDIQKWRDEDKFYYETHSFPTIMDKVRNKSYVTFVGVSGSGKSATAHHIALKLQKEGYEIVPIDGIREIKQYCDTKNPQVFVIDNVVGVFGLHKTKLDVLTDFEQKITHPCMHKSRTLMTCREAVFNETLPYKLFFTKDENVIKLHSSDHALDDNDKKQILQKYGLNKDLMPPSSLTSTSHMFPLLCKLFSNETKFQSLGSKFFLNPVQCLLAEIGDMQRHNKLNYATLVLCMLNENSLSEDVLRGTKNDHFMNMKIDTLESCELESETDAFKFMKALLAMEGTYTKQCGKRYTFIHDSLFEICAYHYGKQFPDKMLSCMSSNIAKYVKQQTGEPVIGDKVKEKRSDSQCNEGENISNDSGGEKGSGDKDNEREESFDLCIRLLEDQCPLLVEILYRDIQNMELCDFFRNQIKKLPLVYQAFIVLEKMSDTESKSLFLSSQREVDKIVSKLKSKLEERGEWETEYDGELEEGTR